MKLECDWMKMAMNFFVRIGWKVTHPGDADEDWIIQHRPLIRFYIWMILKIHPSGLNWISISNNITFVSK